jgi:hypothetical protein
MEETDQPVEEVLVLRVVSAAHRRRVRRAVVAGLVVIVASSGAAVALTHRSGAQPTAQSAPPARLIPAVGTPNPADLAVDPTTRAHILAVARARYASTRDSADSVKTHIEFGRLAVRGDRATLQVNFVCAALCGHGEELRLAKQDGSWRVVGVRQTWLS